VTIGIYCITEIETDKVYIGQSVDIEKRWRTHQKARPITQFHYRVVHQLLDADAEALDTLERFYINMLDCLTPKGLNRTKGGWGKFGHCDAEMRVRISAGGMGKKASDEARSNISSALKGRTFSEEHCAKLSAAAKGRIQSSDMIAKRSAANKGQKRSDETRAKMSAATREQQRRRRDDKEVAYAVV
jgi:hypothetical protein